MTTSFKAFVIDDASSGIRQLSETDLPDEPVLLDVAYSTLNYKDALVITGKAPIVRRRPMIAGIDLAGTVVRSRSPDWRVGDRVVVNGWGLSESHWGGYTERQCVRPEWLVRIPDEFSLVQAMAIGTAGYTAMLCVQALEHANVVPASGEVLVTGAAGGVGSVCIALLAQRGYKVVASTGRPELSEYLRLLGATEIVGRDILATHDAPLQKERWAGVVDSVGGSVLASALTQVGFGGAIATCGMAAGIALHATVLPFIMRGVSVIGIDSVMAPAPIREAAWQRLAVDLDWARLDAMTTVEPMSRLAELAPQMLAGRIRGRVVIDVHA